MARLVLIGSFWDLKINKMAENCVKSVRAFIAIPLPGSVRHLLKDLQLRLKKAGIKASWPRPDGLHLTLKFLGEIPCHSQDQIQAVMDRFSGQYPQLVLAAGSIGVFPKITKARVIWADIRGQTHRLEKLFYKLDKELDVLGIPGQTRPFSPHITLARIKGPVSSQKLAGLIQKCENIWSDEFCAGNMVLYKSTLSARGAIHTRLFHTPLGTSDCQCLQ